MDMRAILMGVGFSVMWSSAYTAAKIAVIDAPPLLLLSARFLLSGLLGIAIARMLGQAMDFSRREWLAIGVLGLFQNTIYLGLIFVALQWIEASVVVIIASLLPLIVASAQWLFLGGRTGVVGVLGLAAGLAGVYLIMSGKLSGGADPLGIALAAAGIASLAAATLLVGGVLSGNRNILMIVGLQMLAGSVTLLPLSLAMETWAVTWTYSLGAAFLWTVFVPGLIATLVWFKLVARVGPTRAATFHFLNPFFGVAIAAALLGESLSPVDIAGVAVIMIGILAVQLSRR